MEPRLRWWEIVLLVLTSICQATVIMLLGSLAFVRMAQSIGVLPP